MHIALRPFQMSRNGITVQIQRGDKVPEAASWAHAGHWMRRRMITDKDGNIRDHRDRIVGNWDDGSVQGVYQPPVTKHKAEPGESVAVAMPEVTPEPVTAAEPEELPPEESTQTRSYTRGDLSPMRKSEVQEIADFMGIDTDQTKEELITEILGD